jgi:hypothetical protein
MSTNGQLFGRRWEVKYLVDRSTRTKLDRDLCGFMDPDIFSNRDGAYTVRSLYFDTPDYLAFHSKVYGAAVRHKLRTRIYTSDPSTVKMVRLEVKSRYLGTVHKIATDVSREEYEEIWAALKTHTLPSRAVLERDHGVREFFRLQKQYNMEPKVVVQYRRRAFARHVVNRVRVNFDDELVACRNLDLLGDMSNARRLMRYGNSVFEVKVDGTMPFWLHMLIDKYGLHNRTFSKFCYSVFSEARTSADIARDT